MTTSARWKRSDRTGRITAGLVLAAVLSWASCGVFAQTGEPADGGRTWTQEKAELIRELVVMTDAAQLEAVFSRQLIDRVASAVTMFSSDMDPRTLQIVREEATELVHQRIESGNALYSVLYPVYAKHFDLFELNKLVRISPQLLTESLDLGSQWGLSLVPEIARRVQARLDERD